ncbi:MAG: hypothetical protein J3K34DRAFT_428092 [Monoraphidium minutum]|nr:MAG: hypothetical protein J3K34DRAFT_428092 [Monoraphidium minutum]
MAEHMSRSGERVRRDAGAEAAARGAGAKPLRLGGATAHQRRGGVHGRARGAAPRGAICRSRRRLPAGTAGRGKCWAGLAGAAWGGGVNSKAAPATGCVPGSYTRPGSAAHSSQVCARATRSPYMHSRRRGGGGCLSSVSTALIWLAPNPCRRKGRGRPPRRGRSRRRDRQAAGEDNAPLRTQAYAGARQGAGAPGRGKWGVGQNKG